MKSLLGVEPGIHGGLAIVAIDDGAAPQLIDAIPLTIIEPTMWKKFHRLRGGDKEAGRQRALQLFPAVHALLARKKIMGALKRRSLL